MLLKTISLRFACAFLLCTGATIALSLNSSAESVATSQNKELILQIQGLTVKNFTAVRAAIEANPGVTFKDYCHSNNTIMYMIDGDVQQDYQFVDLALAPFNLTYQVKEGTITQVQSICEDSHDENPTE